jgi:hypothetical protein
MADEKLRRILHDASSGQLPTGQELLVHEARRSKASRRLVGLAAGLVASGTVVLLAILVTHLT